MVSVSDLRKIRVFNLAIADFAATLLLAFGISLALWKYPLGTIKNIEKRAYMQFASLTILMWITLVGFGLIIHRLVGVQSTLSAYLGINEMPGR